MANLSAICCVLSLNSCVLATYFHSSVSGDYRLVTTDYFRVRVVVIVHSTGSSSLVATDFHRGNYSEIDDIISIVVLKAEVTKQKGSFVARGTTSITIRTNVTWFTTLRGYGDGQEGTKIFLLTIDPHFTCTVGDAP